MAEGTNRGAGVREAGAALRGERFALLFLCALTLAAWVVQYHPFLLPNNDYYSFERLARSLAAFELPGEYKRLPAFPAVMALASPLMPEPHRELHAALVTNAGFALATLALLFVYARRAMGEGAILVPLLFATTVQFHVMGLQPLVEPSLGFFVVLTFVLHQRRSPWQYAAAFVVGLGRAEAATLAPILFFLNWREDGRFWRHAILGALASTGLLAWTALGAFLGKGQSFYLELMEGMGWRPEPAFALRALRESFAFLNVSSPLLLALGLLLVGVPIAFGVASGLRRFRRDALLMLCFFGVATAVVAAFGVNKARYAYPVLWIPLLFCAHGLVRLCDGATQQLARRLPESAGPALLGAACLVWAGVLAFWMSVLGGRPSLALPALDAGYVLACVGIAVWALLRNASPPTVLRRTAAFIALAFLSSAMVSGVARKKLELHEVYHANYASWTLAHWLEENLGPDERIIVLSRKHILHLVDLPKDRLGSFAKVKAEDPAGLAAYMRDDGYELVVWTHRGDVTNRSAAYYHRRLGVALAEAFRDGAVVPGFQHVATLPVPEEADSSDVQVYRLQP